MSQRIKRRIERNYARLNIAVADDTNNVVVTVYTAEDAKTLIRSLVEFTYYEDDASTTFKGVEALFCLNPNGVQVAPLPNMPVSSGGDVVVPLEEIARWRGSSDNRQGFQVRADIKAMRKMREGDELVFVAESNDGTAAKGSIVGGIYNWFKE